MRDTEQLVARVTGGAVHARAAARIDVRPPFARHRPCARPSSASPAGRAERDARGSRRTTRTASSARSSTRSSRRSRRSTTAVFLVDYPATQASLARKKPGDPRVAERFELYVAGVELCNGFGELIDPVEQRARLEHDQAARARAGMPVYPIDERFLEALAAACRPSGGNALGLDRLVALACGTTEIADVIAFTADEL